MTTPNPTGAAVLMHFLQKEWSLIIQLRLPSWMMSVKFKLLVLCLMLGLVPLSLFGFVVSRDVENTLRENAYQNISRVSQLETTTINQWVIERQSDMQMLALRLADFSLDPLVGGKIVNDTFSQLKIYENISIIGLDGKTVYRTDEKQLDLVDRDYFQAALSGETVISD